MRLTAGTRLGPYEIQSFIGAGGMGEVYKARDTRLDRVVAVKLLRNDRVSDPDRRRRFEREARAASALNHPHICTVYDVGSEAGTAFIVMEFVEGETLARRLREGALPLHDVLQYGAQISDALARAHRRGIVHRDLKPGNVMLTRAGAKLLDFGLAKLTVEITDASATTTTGWQPESAEGQVVGTLEYMSPEQAQGRTVDHRSDIFSLGVLLYEMATGVRPFTGVSQAALVSSIIKDTPKPVTEVKADLPPRLSRAIALCLNKDPEERYQSAADLRRDLTELESEPIAPGRASGLRPRLALVWVGALVVLCVAVALLLPRWTIARRPVATATTGSTTSGRVTLAVLQPVNRTGQRQIDDWPALIQSLLATELTGVPDLGVMDVLALNDLLQQAPTAGAQATKSALDTLRRARVTYGVDADIVPGEAGYQIQARVVDTATGESKFSARADVAAEQALPKAARALATQVLSFLQVRGLQGNDKDLRPWISYREQNVEAVKAFVIGSQYVYRRQTAESEPYIRRAIELDPSFVAPKVWLLPLLVAQGKKQEADDLYQSLLTLEPKASPFDQAMIAYVRAFLQRDGQAQAHALELALAYSPGNNILLCNLAYLRFAAGDCAAAVTAMRPAVEGSWRYPELYPVWAWCSVETGHREDAVAGIDRALELFGTSGRPDAYGALEAVALAVGDTGRAATCRRLYDTRNQALGRVPSPKDLVPDYTRLGAYCLRSKSYAEAAALYRKAIAAEPDVAGHHDSLGTALEGLGQAASARKEYERAAGLDPGLIHARERLRALTSGASSERR